MSRTRRTAVATAVAALVVATLSSATAPAAASSVASAAAPTTATALVARSNAVVERRVIGRSVRGREIVAYRKGNPAAARKTVVIGQMHGNEKAGVATAHHLRTSVPVSLEADVWIIPTMNPDGYAAGTRTNARKVDLNRNFPQNWRYGGAGTGTCSGAAAGSEPETRAIMAFLERVQPRYVASVHQPLYSVGSNTKRPAYSARLAKNLGLPLEDLAVCTSTSCQVNTAKGSPTMTSWYNTTQSGAAVTVEYGPYPSTVFIKGAAAKILRAQFAY